MPIYAYKCTACGRQLEVLQKMSDAPLTDCPECGSASLVKQLTAAGFQLKGTGWYATDFRNNGSGKPAESKTDSSKTDSGKTDSGKTDSSKTQSANDAKVDASASDKKPSASAHSCGAGGCSACS